MAAHRKDPVPWLILEAARRLIGDGFPEDLRIADLVVSSEIANGTIYHHFGSRAGLLDELSHRAWRDLRTSLLESERDVEELIARHLAWLAEHPREAKLIARVDVDQLLLERVAMRHSVHPALVRALVFAPVAALRRLPARDAQAYAPALGAAARAGLAEEARNRA